MRFAVLTAIIVAAVGCGAGSAGTVGPSTDLRITVWPQGRDAAANARSYTLRCTPDGGTLPRPGAACDKLTSLASRSRPFAPTPKGAMCTEIYGGPQQAQIVGTFRGKRTWVALSARNGCEIARAKKLAFLLPGFNASSNA
jgi:hypothetical protein